MTIYWTVEAIALGVCLAAAAVTWFVTRRGYRKQ